LSTRTAAYRDLHMFWLFWWMDGLNDG
jgi:hypothetical protein